MLKQNLAIKKLILCFFLLVSFPALSCNLVIKVASSYDWPPYIYQQDSKVVGLEVEILDLILSKTEFCRKYVEMPSSVRAFEELKHKRVDLLIGASFHPERSSYATFSQSYRDEKMLVFAQARYACLTPVLSDETFLQVLNKPQNIIAVNHGSFYGKKFDGFLKTYQGAIVNTTLAKQRFDMLKKDRVDFVIEDELTGKFLLKGDEYKNIVQSTNVVANYDKIHYMLRTDLMSEAQLDQFNKAIEDSRDEINNIIKKYTSNS